MKVCFSILLLLISFSVRSQDFNAELKTGKEAQVGEPSIITLTLIYPKRLNYQPSVVLPDSGSLINNVFEVLEISDQKIRNTGYTDEMKYDVSLICWDTGYHAIPPFKAVYEGDTFLTEPLMVHVPDVKIDL